MDHTIYGYTKIMQFDSYKTSYCKMYKKYIYTMYTMYNIKIYKLTTFICIQGEEKVPDT